MELLKGKPTAGNLSHRCWLHHDVKALSPQAATGGTRSHLPAGGDEDRKLVAAVGAKLDDGGPTLCTINGSLMRSREISQPFSHHARTYARARAHAHARTHTRTRTHIHTLQLESSLDPKGSNLTFLQDTLALARARASPSSAAEQILSEQNLDLKENVNEEASQALSTEMKVEKKLTVVFQSNCGVVRVSTSSLCESRLKQGRQ